MNPGNDYHDQLHSASNQRGDGARHTSPTQFRPHPAPVDESEDELLKTIRSQPFNPTAHSRLGGLYWRQGRVEEALNSLTQALELDSGNREAILNTSKVFMALGRSQEAQEILERYLESHSSDEEARSLLDSLVSPRSVTSPFSAADFMNEQGETQYARGRLDRAQACFEMALEADPDHWTAHCNLGVVRWEQGDPTGALTHLYTAMELRPSDPEVLRNAYVMLRAVGHVDAAAEVLKFYLQNGFGDERAWNDYKEILQESARRSWFPDGLSRDVSTVYSHMGKALFDVGDRAGAVFAWERALSIDPENAAAYFHLATALEEAGESAAAGEILDRATELDPTLGISGTRSQPFPPSPGLERTGTE